MRKIELLAPAKNLEIGIEAIKHGADAVYIGGPSFGARAAAGNSVEEIAELCRFAHFYGAKVYVTFNTILYDHELEEARKLIYQLHDAGVDALIVQDLALCRMQLPPIELHASTQLDITSVEKAQMLEQAGFKQIVGTREICNAKIGVSDNFKRLSDLCDKPNYDYPLMIKGIINIEKLTFEYTLE